MRTDRRDDATSRFYTSFVKASKLIVTECGIGQDRDRKQAAVNTVMDCRAPTAGD